MPFDNTPTSLHITILDKARALISDRKHWHKGGFTHTSEDGTVSYCAWGAVRQAAMGRGCYDPASEPIIALGAVASAMADAVPHDPGLARRCVGDFNDSPTTSHYDILALMDRARDLLLTGEFDAV